MEQAPGTWKLRIIDGTKNNFKYTWGPTFDMAMALNGQSNTFATVDLTGHLTGYSISFYGFDATK
jgi:hypothetical protein